MKKSLALVLIIVSISLVSVMGEDMNKKNSSKIETAVFGGGCFWCVEAVFERQEGVLSVVSGYAGGATVDPTYEQISTGETGHAEVIQVEYNPEEISYKQLLDVFWQAHDPTTLNRHQADVGSQYRSIILYHDQDQRQAAEKSRELQNGSRRFGDPIVTEIEPLTTFYPAEEYHQDYFANNPFAGYCTFVIRPKLKKLGLDL
ncbi:MAG: peptide-methionine (S)-S-oxide reductase MsrA [Spirochaeta sp.]|nr:peptide-methionine (S)-S-oxide reductase MsrA [Spirochaeta sp.]